MPTVARTYARDPGQRMGKGGLDDGLLGSGSGDLFAMMGMKRFSILDDKEEKAAPAAVTVTTTPEIRVVFEPCSATALRVSLNVVSVAKDLEAAKL